MVIRGIKIIESSKSRLTGVISILSVMIPTFPIRNFTPGLKLWWNVDFHCQVTPKINSSHRYYDILNLLWATYRFTNFRWSNASLGQQLLDIVQILYAAPVGPWHTLMNYLIPRVLPPAKTNLYCIHVLSHPLRKRYFLEQFYTETEKKEKEIRISLR